MIKDVIMSIILNVLEGDLPPRGRSYPGIRHSSGECLAADVWRRSWRAFALRNLVPHLISVLTFLL